MGEHGPRPHTVLAPLVLLLSCCLDGSAAAPATSGDRVEAPAVLAELLAGRALVAGERSVDALAPGGARALPSAALLQVPAGSRVRVPCSATPPCARPLSIARYWPG